jgi:polysaccharide biosynthesis transport protein
MNLSKFSLLPTSRAEEAPEQDIDLRGLVAAFRRRLKLFATVALLVLIAVVVVTFQQTPRYTATSNVLIDTRQGQVTDISAVMSGITGESGAIDTEVEILKSRSLAERVVRQQKLDLDPEFNSKLVKPSVFQMIVGAPVAGVQALLSMATPQETTRSAAEAAALLKQKDFERVVDRTLSRLRVRRQGLTYVINVDFTSVDPAKAAVISNSFASLYLTEQLEAKFNATRQANGWLNERLAGLRQEVETAEAAVAQYRIANGMLAAVGSSLTEQEVSQLNQQLAQAQATQAEQDARLSTARRQLAAGSTGEDVGEALGSNTVSLLRQQRATVSARSADLQTRYGPRHPEVQRVQRELADIDGQIQAEINRVISNLDAQAQVARQRTGSIQASLNRARGTLAGTNAASVRLNELERNAAAVRALYDSFLSRFKETTASQGMEESDARVVSQAKIPNKASFPNKQLNLAIGLALGLLAGVAAVVVAETLENGLATSEDVERYLNIPHLGAVPLLSSTMEGAATGQAPGDYLAAKPLSAFAESFRNLRTSLMHSKIDAPVRVIAVTSSLPAEGKTTSTFCLGRSMALSGSSTVVVDCDLRRRSINRLLGIDPTVGLVEVLSGTATLAEALIRDEVSGAFFLPLAKSAFTPKDLFGSQAFDKLLVELKSHFDMVLLDCAPVLPVAEPRVIAPKADVVLFLAQWRKTPRKAVQAALQLLQSVRADVAGVALTQVDVREQAKYGYGDAGYYYRSYKKYYAS